ncbi:G2/mitotic-specific cyclin-2-like [Gastrolobium bilobum]|uniref:G2/mitotic-specific cyclin-2-like n=1 Tax=Gastrolobium bilobum TaxID=150636 RepID=UPI002AB18D67|nr:G2/mitotic-specific cyclin-2-like [Gastrolobium bilobum]
MEGSKENHLAPSPSIMPSSNLQGDSRMKGVKLVKETALHHRLPLSNINQNIMDNKKPCVVSKVDLSWKCTAQTVQHYPQETKKQNPLALTPCYHLDSAIVEIDEYEDASDNAVPIFVKHTEAMLDEIDRIEEIEMEDMDEPVMDIDACDRNDPLAVVEYIDDIYCFYRKTENSSRASSNYLSSQFDIKEKMRAILIDWLIEVHYKFELLEETLFLTVNLIDRFMERQAVIRKKLQLVGVTAMLIACKYEEVSVPTVEDFILITDKAYTRNEVLKMEKLMVNILQFNLSVPTPYVFMRRFLKAAHSDKKLELLSSFLIELCLVEYKMLEFSPSLLAAAAVYTAQCSLYQFKQWTKTSEWYTEYSEEKLLECSRLMVTFHRKAGSGKLTGVYRKYSTWKYGCAAKIEPALFLLDSN